MYWRYQLKQVLPSNRKVIFWRNNAENVTSGPDDILHYWGSQEDVAKGTWQHILVVKQSESKIILSPSDLLYLNKGMGFIWQNSSFGTYSVWRKIYDDFVVFPTGVEKSRILGAEVCAWGEVINEDTLENTLWPRASTFAARVWSEPKIQTHELLEHLVHLNS